MRIERCILSVVICFALLGCGPAKNSSETNNTLPATALKPFGRYTINSNQNIELISSAVHFGFTFTGNQCTVYASTPYGHNYLQYEIDGVYQKRMKVTGNSPAPIVLTAQKDGKHTVWIYKATEAHTGAVVIHKLDAQNVKPLASRDAPLIEFIGNSITCGAAADPSEVPCGTGQYHDQHNAYYAYGPRVARALGANYILSSVSGIGIYRNWNSDGPTMPKVYEKVDFQMNSIQTWNFKSYTPKVVSIALGTNDFSKGDGIKKREPFDSAAFVNHYIDFVKQVISKYPSSQVALLSSPMINGTSRSLFQNCLTAVKQKIDVAHVTNKPLAVYFFEPMQARGCTGHPNVEDHAIMAKELEPFFKMLLESKGL